MRYQFINLEICTVIDVIIYVSRCSNALYTGYQKFTSFPVVFLKILNDVHAGGVNISLAVVSSKYSRGPLKNSEFRQMWVLKYLLLRISTRSNVCVKIKYSK